ncbi:amidohydrolase family protein, partial [Colletotrichum scovillei]
MYYNFAFSFRMTPPTMTVSTSLSLECRTTAAMGSSSAAGRMEGLSV